MTTSAVCKPNNWTAGGASSLNAWNPNRPHNSSLIRCLHWSDAENDQEAISGADRRLIGHCQQFVHTFGTPYLFGGISIAKTVTLHIRNPSPLSQFLTEITTFYYYNVILNNFKR